MTQPIIPVTQPASLFTVGEQGPPGIGVSFGGMVFVTFATTGATLVSGAFTPIDCRGGPVTVVLPPAIDGSLVGIGDTFAFSSVNPIGIQAQGAGVTVADPSNAGSFAAFVHLAAPGGPTLWFAFNLGPGGSVNKWLPVWW
jgi:hypothetical protein